MKLLIIEDEKSLNDAIVEYLSEDGHVCEAVYTYTDAIEKIEMYNYDSIVVDINLPDGSGLDIIKRVKKSGKSMGIVIISARNSLENKIEGLETGADNYLTKPFHLAELNAHLKSILRRISFNGSEQIVFNELKLLPGEHSVFVHDTEVNLTRKEYELLVFFISNKNKVITKSGLAEHLWGDYMDMADSYDFIYTHIKNLRNKLLKEGCADYIKTVYGVGYKFEISESN
ncbi:MAG: response regulator transcription factor [Bacteroidetes bacterium]|nr:response regulator transcription factor [Bacteroidota bacterium]